MKPLRAKKWTRYENYDTVLLTLIKKHFEKSIATFFLVKKLEFEKSSPLKKL